MLQWLREWIINICVAVFFITAIEMILPSNSMKKYCNFVLGLILVTVILNPIISIFNKNNSPEKYIAKATEEFNENKYKEDFDDYKKKSIEKTSKNFKKNIETMTKKDLEKEFPQNKYKVTVDVAYTKENTFDIKAIKIGVKDGSVERIKKVSINRNNEKKQSEDTIKSSPSIKKFISNKLDISKSKINIYKL